MIGAQPFAELVTRIIAIAPREREFGADAVGDVVGAFDQGEAESVARLLALTASVEPESDAREAQLNAIVEIIEHFDLTAEVLAPLRAIRIDELDDQQREYLRDLSEEVPGLFA
ncbi:hypothetical protein ABT297_15385 [Dactylosporangium sp. NPDC000555]|uniref:hypothetical protein n=1 Tax=Dactylosporangium sp. NPDC000555 TaxID=3154260 RepID=UPI003316F765